MKGTIDDELQIDESYFAGKRKYNRGRLRAWDKRVYGGKEARDEMDKENLEVEWAEWQSVDPDPCNTEPKPSSKRNYGNRVIGPWVVGIASSSEVRFFVVENRKGDTLRALIKENCEQGSYIFTDEWRGYSRLHEDGFIHRTVNHSKNFVNPENGAHTQLIERFWVEGKGVMRRHRKVSQMFQGHLDEISFRRRAKKDCCTVLQMFWKEVSNVHSTST